MPSDLYCSHYTALAQEIFQYGSAIHILKLHILIIHHFAPNSVSNWTSQYLYLEIKPSHMGEKQSKETTYVFHTKSDYKSETKKTIRWKY